MHIRNTTIFVAMAAIYGFVLGFGYGNLFEAKYGFELKEWQTLAGVLVAVGAAMLAYIGVRGTQRISVMTKEQERLDASLPGLRKVNELLIAIRGPLSALQTRCLYQAGVLLDSAIRVAPTESVETAVRRQIPLADDHLKWEVAEILFSLRSQAALLKVGQEEIERYRKDLANIHTFAPDQHDGLRDITKQVEASHKRENEQMRKLVVSLDKFAQVVKLNRKICNFRDFEIFRSPEMEILRTRKFVSGARNIKHGRGRFSACWRVARVGAAVPRIIAIPCQSAVLAVGTPARPQGFPSRLSPREP